MAAAADGPLCRISAYVDNFLRVMGKYNGDGIFKTYIGIKMVIGKPTLLCLFRQNLKNIINGFPFVA